MPTEITSNFKTLADIRGRKETLLKGIREDNEKMGKLYQSLFETPDALKSSA